MVNKTNRVLGMIKHSFSYLDKNSLKLLFTSLVGPILEYAAPIWNPHSMGKLNKLKIFNADQSVFHHSRVYHMNNGCLNWVYPHLRKEEIEEI
jgi:hypothetical protein